MSTPIVFIFQGSKLPKYIIHSLKLNRKLSPDLEIYFVSNLRLNERVLGINEVAIDSFYRSSFNSYFSSEKKNKWWDGFWNKTLERFFVLEVFMQEYDFQSVIHMEVDNIGFDLAKTAGIISEFGQGMYYPTYPEKTSAASILFVNGTSSIAHFNSFIKKNNNKDDMQLLYEYRTSADSTAKDLPIDINAKNLKELGIFDLNFS